MIALALVIVLAGTEPVNLCNLCHPDVKVLFEGSVHSSEGIGCTSCHGGDETVSSVDRAHRGRFIGVPRRRDVPELCASCHSDVEQMRPYNIPTHQYALYQTSGHGKLLAKGDEKVAVCTDCHGVHDIFKEDDPRSRVFVRNISKTCAECHSDRELMSPYGQSGDPYEDYKESIHAEALLDEGNLGAPECSRCHGAHGAAPPGIGDLNKVCGQCHGNTRAYFLEGPHGGSLFMSGYAECVSCHDHHRVVRAELGLLQSVCVECHEKGSAETELADKMKALFTGASEEIERARAIVDRAQAIPLYVEDYRARLEEARTSLVESLPVMHSLDLARVESLTHRARSIGNEVESELTGKLEEREWHRVGLMLFWFYLLLTVAILVRYRARAARGAAP